MIFPSTHRSCLNRNDIYTYLDQPVQFSKDEIHAIESHLLDCSLCNSAVEGYAFLKASDYPVFLKKMRGSNTTTQTDISKKTDKLHRSGKKGKTYPLLKDIRKSVWHDYFGENNNSDEPIAAEQLVGYNTGSRLKKSRAEAYDLVERQKKFKWVRNFPIRVAGMLLIIIVGFSLFSIFSKGGEDILQTFGSGEELLIKVRGNQEESDQTRYPEKGKIKEAISLFEQGKFIQGGRIFESLIDTEEGTNYTISFFAGLSYLNAGDLQKSQRYLEKSIERDHIFTDEAYWYLARLYLEKGEIEKAKTSLQYVLSSDDTELRQRARKILRRI